MSAFSHAWSFRKRPFDPPYPKTPWYTRKSHGSVCYWTGLWTMEILHLENMDFRLFCFCDLDFDPMTFTYEPDPYSLKIHRMCKYERPTSRLSKIIVRQTHICYMKTDRQTRPKLSRRFDGGQKSVTTSQETQLCIA